MEMAEAGHLASGRSIKSILSWHPTNRRSHKLLCHASKTIAVPRRKDMSVIAKKGCKTSRRLITISTGDGRWHGKWTSQYLFSLQELQLEDLIEDEQRDTEVSINLCVQKRASFGFSVDGRIITSFTGKCSNCSSPYCKEIDTKFNVWVLPCNSDKGEITLPEIGGDDPSVIYVKPGYESNLDPLIQDTIRLTTSVKDTCLESCDRSEPTLQFPTEIVGRNVASIYKRWSRLLELKQKSLPL
ncbi:large ribosomal RNA subunit accumulation protein YCED homolog 2, chloroplastic [Hevea brasiliensis]|uniref:large ribosomal RNA subunit accumulation protein YCED homolog 2, chloroplastic n=1 Tax=Hevea brasiliensis TaxID=3981 RepID=UPI0025F7AE2D|nr:large ribosomal RNA subunit accumulation protein YCED homolog 2, chloroplastic [Hevea brasiliensis]